MNVLTSNANVEEGKNLKRDLESQINPGTKVILFREWG